LIQTDKAGTILLGEQELSGYDLKFGGEIVDGSERQGHAAQRRTGTADQGPAVSQAIAPMRYRAIDGT
jgi:hypothetical protein